MTVIHPDALLAAMPDLDADVACEVLDTSTSQPCGASAVWRVRAHGYRTPHDRHCSINLMLMCDPCLAYFRDRIEQILTEGPTSCRDCGLSVAQVSDVLRSVVAL